MVTYKLTSEEKTKIIDDKLATIFGRYLAMPDEIIIFLGSIYGKLRREALEQAIELKEEHVSDEIIATIIHESLHSLIDDYDVGAFKGGVEEERVVEVITEDVMEEVRKMPHILQLYQSPIIREKYLKGHGIVPLRRPRVRCYGRKKRWNY